MSLRLFWNIVTTEARKRMSYRVDFWLNSVVGLIAGILIPYFLWQAIFAESSGSTIGGYTLEGMVLYYILAVLIGRIVQGPDLILTVSADIYEGDLSRYLLYPAGYLRFKYAQHLGGMVSGLVQITVFGVLFALLLPHPEELSITPASALRCVFAVLLGNLLYFLLSYPIQIVAFWADNVWSLSVLLRFGSSLLGGLILPLALFPVWASEALLFSPFPYLFWFPVSTLIGDVTMIEWLRGVGVMGGWCVVLAVAGRLLWKRGELSYTGVGI